MMKKLDINGVEPKVGDMIVYNPPRIKGIRCELCVGLSKVGLPMVIPQRYLKLGYTEKQLLNLAYTPKTGFAVINITKIENIVHV